MKKVTRALFAAALALGAGIRAAAEPVTVTVVDRDLGMPLEGAIVRPRGGEALAADAEGRVVLELAARSLASVEYPGYETRRAWIDPGDGEVSIELGIAETIEGEELVVEAEAYRPAVQQAGVSRTVDREAIKSTARIGMIEDVMSSVKLLPGVAYSGGWGQLPSIRGADPGEFSSAMDGFYVRYPFHWGGAFSIYSPHLVDSATLSHGVFSARYGNAMSGLLEVRTREPSGPDVRWEANVSTSATDFFLQAPLGETAGFYLGGKVTYLEGIFALAGDAASGGGGAKMTQVPYVRDAFGRFRWTPGPRFQADATLFFGSDGVAVTADNEDKGIKSSNRFSWANAGGFGVLGLRFLPTADVALRATLGYNKHSSVMEADSKLSGGRAYSDAFKQAAAENGWVLPGEGYDLGTIDPQFRITSTQSYDIIQARLEADVGFGDGLLLGAGAEAAYDLHDTRQEGRVFLWETASYHDLSVDGDGIGILKTAAFLEADLGLFDRHLEAKAGLRVDHLYIKGKDFGLNTYPVANPRLNLRWTVDPGKTLALVAGTGLFSSVPAFAPMIEKKYGFGDFDLGPDASWLSVAGAEYRPDDEWLFSLEGYYRRYLGRTYVNDMGTGIGNFKIHRDGTGNVFGADLLVEKRLGRNLDGFLSYSFAWARLRNPTTDGEATANFPGGEPLGIDYWPSYHRFHNANLVLNYRPLPGVQLSGRFTFASGKPLPRVGLPEPDPVVYGSQVVERWKRDSTYDDDQRTGFSVPLDLKLAFSGFYPGTKVKSEFYFAVENLLVLWYKPEGNSSFDPYTGKVLPDKANADFALPFPVPSFGLKISY